MATEGEVSNERWSKAVIGLPNDFLRLTPRNLQESVDREAAFALQQQIGSFNPIGLAGFKGQNRESIIVHLLKTTPKRYALATSIPQSIAKANTVGRLSITVAQAKLVKNYGLTRMDPYVRIRVGHYIYETQTDPNGGKTPRWNRVFHTQLPAGVNKIFIEIYDECNFTMDELIAWTEVRIPDVVLERGETHEDWYPLSGKSGELKEGMIDLVLSFTSAANIATARPTMPHEQPVVFVPNPSGRSLPVYVQQQPTMQPQQVVQPQPPQPLTEEDVSNLMEMFPSVDKDVIKSIGEANRGNKEATINSLLQLTN